MLDDKDYIREDNIPLFDLNFRIETEDDPVLSSELLPVELEGKLGDKSEQDNSIIKRAYSNLLHTFKVQPEKEDLKNIRAAFEMAAEAHKTQMRKSGEPYILHPIEVARICIEEIGLGPTAAICALLHDVVEDTSITIMEIDAQFGGKVAKIVDGLTKLDGLHDSESPQAENLSKVLKAMLNDTRVVLIKIADRLHNLRTIRSMPQHKQIKIAAETSTIYAPIAHRLGLHKIKSEFQDICLKITHPEEYADIASKIAETRHAREKYIETFLAPVREPLMEIGVPLRIHGRPKSIYSIWNKMKNKGVAFEQVYDLFAVRIIADVPPEEERKYCWFLYSVIVEHYQQIPDRMKDFISNPKSNGYESLHTTVAGPNGRFVEVQIRSERMDEIAERGFAAHWKYKGVKSLSKKAKTFDNWLDSLRDTLVINESSSAVEFLMDVQSTFYNDEVHVFTPKGEMRVLPEGATALDFAFGIHSDLGCSTRVVRINNKVMPITTKLKTGDQVEIITDSKQKPTEDWLKYVVTGKARNRIKAALKEDMRRDAEFGKETLERKLNGLKVGFEENVDMLARWYNYPNRTDFMCAIHHGQVDLLLVGKRFRSVGNKLEEIELIKPGQVVHTDFSPAFEPIHVMKSTSTEKPQLLINGEPGNFYAYSFASCCNPVQGDDIFAYITVSEGAKIHRTNCKNAPYLLTNYSHRVQKASWGATTKTSFVAEIVVTGIDIGPGVINELTNKIADMGINIRSFSITGDAGYFEGRISLVIVHTDVLQRAMQEIRKLKYVTNVSRVE